MDYTYAHIAGNEYLVTLEGDSPESITIVVYESEDEIAALVDYHLEARNAPREVPLPQYPRLTVRDFLALFTMQEKLAIKAATRVSDELGLWYDEMLAAQYISIEDPATAAGLEALVAAGLLTAERHDEIIAAMQPAISEQPTSPV